MPPDSMTGFSPRPVETLIVALCVVCTWTGVNNLLNHTFLAKGHVEARNKYGGYRNKTRSTVRLRRLSFPAVISTIQVSRYYPTGSLPGMHQHALTDHSCHHENFVSRSISRDRFFSAISPDQHKHK
jgi:hypothetical protein